MTTPATWLIDVLIRAADRSIEPGLITINAALATAMVEGDVTTLVTCADRLELSLIHI